MARYYEQEHLDGYARVKREGLTQWSDLHETLDGFEHFPNRPFLERVLPVVGDDTTTRVLEYGCGTGPAACFLTRRGYAVRGVDLVPDAIELARRRAAELGLRVEFAVEDVCRWDACPPPGGETERYDVVLDSFCLQSVVLDQDRARLLDGVRRRLLPTGRYVLSTAMYEPARDYGDDRYDADTGIVWTSTVAGHADAHRVGGSWWSPYRRHLTADALRAELGRHGFRVLEQAAAGGDVVCTVRSSR